MAHIVVRLPQEITADNLEPIGNDIREVLRSLPDVLEPDLGRVTHLSSEGSAVFFTALLTARTQGTKVIAARIGPQPRAALRQLGPTDLITMYGRNAPATS